MEQNQNDSSTNEIKVLVIDDEQSYLDLIADTLHNKNYKILQALNGVMGCMVARKFSPDIIITDWEMPELDGVETIRVLKDDPITKDIPVIMCTGIMTSSENLETALNVGAIDYIRKPVDPLELLARISSALNLSQSIKKIRQQNEKLVKLNTKITQKNTEISEQNEQLQYLNATKDKFFSIIAHDLRNPFNNILGMSDVLMTFSHDMDKEKMLEVISSINTSAKSAYNLLGNLLDWAMSQTGRLVFSPQKILIKDIINNSIEVTEGNCQSKNIKLEYEPHKDIFVYADKNMLNTVFSNLITNAIKYTRRDGQVKISIDENDGYAKVKIKDNGIGISQDRLSSLFSINKKKSTLGTEKERGSGLGLLLCKDFIDKHGGEIGAESEKDVGSTFWCTIPLRT